MLNNFFLLLVCCMCAHGRQSNNITSFLALYFFSTKIFSLRILFFFNRDSKEYKVVCLFGFSLKYSVDSSLEYEEFFCFWGKLKLFGLLEVYSLCKALFGLYQDKNCLMMFTAQSLGAEWRTTRDERLLYS